MQVRLAAYKWFVPCFVNQLPLGTLLLFWNRQLLRLLTHLPTYLLTYSPTYLLTHLPTYLLTHLPTYLLTYLPTSDGSLSVEELRVKAREEFIDQGRAQLEAEGVEDVSVSKCVCMYVSK